MGFSFPKIDNSNLILLVGGAVGGIILANFVMDKMKVGKDIGSLNAPSTLFSYAAAKDAGFPHTAYLNTLPSNAEYPINELETWRLQTLNGLADGCPMGLTTGPPLHP